MGRAKRCGLKLSADQLARITAAEQRKAQPIQADEVRIGGRALTPSQRTRLSAAEGLAKGGLSERRKAAAMVRQVEAELRAAREAEAVEAGVTETVARDPNAFEIEDGVEGDWRRNEMGGLVRVHGQPILDARPVRRTRRLDGLRSMHRAGLIDDGQMETLDRYRSVYASAQPPLSTTALDRDRGTKVDREAPMAAAIERGNAAVLLGDIRRAIGSAAADLLEAVAGRGESIRGLSAGGKQWQANHAVLLSSIPTVDLLITEARNRRLSAVHAKCI